VIISVSSQARILLASLYGGLILGIFFDVYRLIRNGLQFNKLTTIIGDICFWAVGLTVSLVVIYESSSGLVRFYQILGFAAGMAMYLKVLSRYVNGVLNIIFRSIRNMLYFIFMVIKIPFIILSNLLWKPYDKSKAWLAKILAGVFGETRKYLKLFTSKK